MVLNLRRRQPHFLWDGICLRIATITISSLGSIANLVGSLSTHIALSRMVLMITWTARTRPGTKTHGDQSLIEMNLTDTALVHIRRTRSGLCRLDSNEHSSGHIQGTVAS